VPNHNHLPNAHSKSRRYEIGRVCEHSHSFFRDFQTFKDERGGRQARLFRAQFAEDEERNVAAESDCQEKKAKKSKAADANENTTKTHATKDSTYAEISASLQVVGQGLQIKESTINGAGLGVFTVGPIGAGQVITEYYGAYVEWKEAKGRESSHMRALFPMRLSIDGLYMSDGKTKITNPSTQLHGYGAAAFSNDARSEEENNAEFQTVHSESNRKAIDDYLSGSARCDWTAEPGESKVILVAIKDIGAGEEIFVSYGADYW
jgi:hypothetical protein